MSKKSGAVADPLSKAINAHDQTVRGTEIVLVVDETGSMMARKDATISSINEFIVTQKQSPNPAWVTMTFFNSQAIRTPLSGEELVKVKDVDPKSYNPANGTPLYDAIGKTVREIEKRREKMKDEDKPAVLFLIVTDGEENESREFKKADIVKLLEEKEKDGWTFAYIGAQRDAWQDGAAVGIRGQSTYGYTASTPVADLAGIKTSFAAASLSTTAYRSAVTPTRHSPLSTVHTESFFTDPTKLGTNDDDDANTVTVKTDTSTNEPPKP